MTFSLDPEVAAALQATLDKNGPPPTPPAGDVQSRRAGLDAMLDYFNNQAQPPAADVEVTDYEVTAADGAPHGVVEHSIFEEELVDRRAATRRIGLAEDVAEVAKQ